MAADMDKKKRHHVTTEGMFLFFSKFFNVVNKMKRNYHFLKWNFNFQFTYSPETDLKSHTRHKS